MAIHIGTSGWSYEHWSDVLYPADARSADRLRYYTQAFKTVELNSSFYRWPKRQRSPDGVVVCPMTSASPSRRRGA